MSLLLTAIALAIAAVAYWRFVRPHARALFPDLYAWLDETEASLWARLAARARKFWDLNVGVALMVGPELPGLLDGFMTLDLSGIVAEDTTKAIAKLIGLILFAVRAWRTVRAAAARQDAT